MSVSAVYASAPAVAAADATGAEHVGILGFCMGGMYALKAAATGRFDRVVSFYGMARVPPMWASATQGEPLDALAAAPGTTVLALAGSADPWLPADDRDALAVHPSRHPGGGGLDERPPRLVETPDTSS